jgi:MFS family permease
VSAAAPRADAAVARTANLPWLYAGRALRSFATAVLTVVFPLYLARSGYGAGEVGLVLSLGGVIGMALVLAVGLGADRFGRRRAILGLALLTAAGAFALAFLPPNLVLVALASGLGGIGRGGGAGSGGAWGPVFPAEQPLLAEAAPPTDRTRVFGMISFVGVLAGALGSLVAGLPTLALAHGVALVAGYRLLFAVGGVFGLAMAAVTLPVRETPPALRPRPKAAPPLPVGQLIGRLSVTNGLNGFAIGFLGPLFTYWLYRRFGVGSAEIGALYALVNLASAIPYLGSAGLARRLGTVRTVVVTRALGAAGLVVLPFLPSFLWVGVVYTARMVLNSLGMPARQSFTMAVSDERYRGRVSALGSLPSQITSLVSPAVAGAVMDSWLDFPLFGAAAFMFLNALAYHLAFHAVAVPGEASAASGGDDALAPDADGTDAAAAGVRGPHPPARRPLDPAGRKV